MTRGGGKVRQPAGRPGSPGTSPPPAPPGPQSPGLGSSRPPTSKHSGRAPAPRSIRPQAAGRAGPPAAGLTPGAPRAGSGPGGRGRQDGAPEGTASTVMALNSCQSAAAAEPGRPPPPPPPPRRPPGAAPASRGTTGHFTAAHTRSRPQGAGDAGGHRGEEPERPGARRGWAGTLRSAAPVSTPRGRHSRCPPNATPPSPLAPRPASAAPTFAQLGRRSFPAPHSGPATCLASRVRVVTTPRTARFLLSPPSHLPPNLLPTPAPRPPPRHGIRRGRPQCLSSRPRPSPARPVRPQRWAGGWAAAAAAAEAAAAAAEAARSTIVFLTLCAPTLRLFPFLPPPVPPHPALHSHTHTHTHTPPAANRCPRSPYPTGSPPSARRALFWRAGRRRYRRAPRGSAHLVLPHRGAGLQVGSSLLLLGALLSGGASAPLRAGDADDGEVPGPC
ncbi:basic proline-rich protein-like [Balaenoptera musculus]|uniref:Basic proline-rich protein-like n=1 Tax=Balaenoptera musculus TaxID=9771 RepID=A0A8B8WDD3_BALMU|nr:basic proline-rich protein-like [Balaenoptera musculus]